MYLYMSLQIVAKTNRYGRGTKKGTEGSGCENNAIQNRNYCSNHESIMFSMPSSVQNTTAHVSAQVIRRGINGSI